MVKAIMRFLCQNISKTTVLYNILYDIKIEGIYVPTPQVQNIDWYLLYRGFEHKCDETCAILRNRVDKQDILVPPKTVCLLCF